MDAYEKLLNDYESREAEKLKQKLSDQRKYEEAAKQAHRVRNAARLLVPNAPVIDWEGLSSISQKHLIADAENVALNPSITADELARLYRERLVKWGDLDSSDLLNGDDEEVEGMVLEQLKACFAAPLE